MRYLSGSFADMQKIRAAVDKLAGYPFAVEQVPIPPRAATYSPGAIGWMEHLLSDPHHVGNGAGLLFASDDILPYCGQSADVEGETVAVPPESALVEREQLSPELQQWLYNYDNPPPPFGGVASAEGPAPAEPGPEPEPEPEPEP